MRHAIALVLLVVVLANPARAAESFDNCSGYIDSVPATLTVQGVWCLRADLSTAISSGNAITIANNNITIDCNHFKLGGLGAGIDTLAVGIGASGRLNATVRNCNVRGFRVGIQLQGDGHIVEDNRFEASRLHGVHVIGDGNIVRHNVLVDTGGASQGGTSAAIRASSGRALVQGNVINGVTNNSGALNAVGVVVAEGSYSVVQDNQVSGLTGAQDIALAGLLTSNSGYVLFRGNNVSYFPTTVSYGILCSSASCACRDNIAMGPTTGTQNCPDLGGNSHVP